jgi:hypothetical protein
MWDSDFLRIPIVRCTSTMIHYWGQSEMDVDRKHHDLYNDNMGKSPKSR